MAEKLKISKALREYWRANGAEGGKIGGRRRAQALSPARRSEIAALGAKARWNKVAPPAEPLA